MRAKDSCWPVACLPHLKAFWSCGGIQSHGHGSGQLPSSSQRRGDNLDLWLSICRITSGYVPILNQLTLTSGARCRWERTMIGLAWVRHASWNNYCQGVGHARYCGLDQTSTSRPTSMVRVQGQLLKTYFADADAEKGVVVPRVLGRQKNRPHYRIIESRKHTCHYRDRDKTVQSS